MNLPIPQCSVNRTPVDYHNKIVTQQYHPDWKVFIEDRQTFQSTATFPKSLLSTIDMPDSSSKPDEAPLSMPAPNVSFVKDAALKKFAAAAAQEASRCFGSSAFTATAVMAGSAIEAVLLDLLLQHQEKLNISKDDPIEKWQLGDLIKTASRMNLLGAATTTLTQFAQQNRNLIHPGKFLREKRIIAQSDAHIIWGIFIKICEELSSTAP